MSLPEPITRREQYLNRASGGSGSIPDHPITREEQYLAAIAEGGGGSDLPEVSDADNGDVLGVVNGAWDKMEAPGGLPPVTSADNGKVLAVEDGNWTAAEDEFVVTFTKSGSTWSADKMLTDIADAIIAKKRVYGKVAASLVSSNSTFSTETFLLPLSAKPDTISYGYQFAGAYQTGTTTLFVNIVVALVPPLTQTVTAYVKEIELASELPVVSSHADDYKVLTAMDGGWGVFPACHTVVYTNTGPPVGGVYPLSSSADLSDIQDALSANANVRATLTLGTDTAIMYPVSRGADYVRFSAVIDYNHAWCVFSVLQYIDTQDNEACEGMIVPLNTTQMSYNTSTDELSITNVPEVSS